MALCSKHRRPNRPVEVVAAAWPLITVCPSDVCRMATGRAKFGGGGGGGGSIPGEKKCGKRFGLRIGGDDWPD